MVMIIVPSMMIMLMIIMMIMITNSGVAGNRRSIEHCLPLHFILPFSHAFNLISPHLIYSNFLN